MKEPKDNDNNESEIMNKAVTWCVKEKMRHFTASALERTSLYESFVYLTSKLNPPPSKSAFPQLSMGRKGLTKESG